MRELINKIMSRASVIKYSVSDQAPNTELDLFNNYSLKVWSGASDNTIWGDARVNWAFRSLHDQLHLETRLDFTPEHEIELGRIQANQYSGLLADLIYIEVSGQAEYYKVHGVFVQDQVQFTRDTLVIKYGRSII